MAEIIAVVEENTSRVYRLIASVSAWIENSMKDAAINLLSNHTSLSAAFVSSRLLSRRPDIFSVAVD
jgi:hypothetical protein